MKKIIIKLSLLYALVKAEEYEQYCWSKEEYNIDW